MKSPKIQEILLEIAEAEITRHLRYSMYSPSQPQICREKKRNVILPVGDERDMGFCNPEYQLSSQVRFNSPVYKNKNP